MKTLNDIFSSWMVQGIFSYIANKHPPWESENISLELDLVYHGNFSGNKYISPLLDFMTENADDETIGVVLNKIADVIIAINGKRWEKLWNTLLFEYNPIENYSMIEEMTNDESVTEYGKTTTTTNNLIHGRTGTDSNTNSVYGFNQNVMPTPTGSGATTYGTTDTDTGTQGNAETGSDTITRNYTLTRSGNIGVTTSQQMIESERNLWMWNFFRDVVFPDIDKILTINIY